MDPSLLREREAFLKRARVMPVVEALRPAPTSVISTPEPPSNRRLVNTSNEFRSMDSRPANQGKFAILSRVVKYMKQRHLDRDVHPLSVDEILEETMLQDISASTFKWLEEEALPNNPKIKLFPDKKFVFKPKYDVKNRQELYQLLKRHDLKGLGGVFLDDISEGVADAESVVMSLGDHVIQVSTPHDKKTVLFHNDKSFDLNIDEDFKQQWRAVSVEGVNEKEIEEYLRQKGITSMSGERKGFIQATRRKRPGERRKINRPVKLKDNEHLTHVLKDFSEPR